MKEAWYSFGKYEFLGISILNKILAIIIVFILPIHAYAGFPEGENGYELRKIEESFKLPCSDIGSDQCLARVISMGGCIYSFEINKGKENKAALRKSDEVLSALLDGNNLDIEAAQTGITSIKHNSLILGGNSQNNTIDFGTDDKIIFDIDNAETALVHSTGLDVHGTVSASYGSFTSGSFNTLVIGSGSRPSNYGGLTLTEISASGNISSSGTIYASTGSIGRVESDALKGTKIFGSGAHLDNDVNLDRGSDARGDILYRGTTDYVRLAGGSANTVLIMGLSLIHISEPTRRRGMGGGGVGV